MTQYTEQSKVDGIRLLAALFDCVPRIPDVTGELSLEEAVEIAEQSEGGQEMELLMADADLVTVGSALIALIAMVPDPIPGTTDHLRSIADSLEESGW